MLPQATPSLAPTAFVEAAQLTSTDSGSHPLDVPTEEQAKGYRVYVVAGMVFTSETRLSRSELAEFFN